MSKSANTYIRGLYSEGFSSLTMSLYKSNLTFGFAPWLKTDNFGRGIYNNKEFQSVSINHEGAAVFYKLAHFVNNCEILDIQLKYVLPCNNDATLTFEFKPDENNQLVAYLVLNKNNVTIPFKFYTHQYEEIRNGRNFKRIVQPSLGAFAMALKGYLTSIPADVHFRKFSEEELENLQGPSTMRNGSYY